MKIRFVFNPFSGRLRRSPGVLHRIRGLAAPTPGRIEVVPTAHAGHATALAAEAAAAGADLVVAVGGDGTMNECARALLGRPTALALVPCGSGNGLARHLGIPLDLEGALGLLDTGRPRPIDAGFVNGEPFFCAAGTGFEARISAVFNRSARRGFLRYLTHSAREYWHYRPLTYSVRTAGAEARRLEAFTLTFANAAQYGNGARIAPGALLDDGRLNLVAVPPVRLHAGPGLLWRLFRGRLRESTDVTTLSAAAFTIAADRPLEFHLDGEVRPPAPRLEVTVRPRCLRVLAPAA